MPQRIRRFMTQCLVLIFAAAMGLATTPPAVAQDAVYTQAELDQMLAPIALYPDSLLTQVLMASTYPLEVVEAARWSRDHPGLKGDQAVREANRNDWDPSVLSLLAFPQVLQMMDEHLDWTEQLGDAFLAQEDQVMDTVQRLRDKAWEQGSLRSNRYLRVAREHTVIVIEPADPEIVYVPYYDPLVVYGAWWWPGYPPYYWIWPGYYVGPTVGIYWGTGITVGVGFFFGNFDWPRRHVTIVNVNNYYFRPHVTHREWLDRKGPFRWEHDPSRRGNVPYHGFTPRPPERVAPSGEPRQFPRQQTQPTSPALQPKPDLRRDMPVIINPAQAPETRRRLDQRPEIPRGEGERRDRRITPPGQDHRLIDVPRSPRPPAESPQIIRPESSRPRPPEPGSSERRNDNRRFEQRQPGAETPRVPRSTGMPTIIRPEPARPRQPDVGVPERHRAPPQIERRQIERPNAAPSARPSFAPRPEEPRRGGQVPPRQIINQGNPGSGQDH
ncbi:protein of unknown function [Pseudogulbenkiania sp. NH8B]|uniref:DUF3300 domain-containing protein n=1 Tax=Pseudogulbenkiania sp. (strain NH8B) TaxID=748280 RepID=UPI0002279A46|nr:DUF3300 domain-containing protein [Pseudogulbenkiania sp. NH8B]BAK76837.1 protein of unknown function [Pseudogulbenkiania sp. NH8B]